MVSASGVIHTDDIQTVTTKIASASKSFVATSLVNISQQGQQEIEYDTGHVSQPLEILTAESGKGIFIPNMHH